MSEREIFTAALNKQDLAERDAFLDEACAGDSQLRQRVEALLTEHQIHEYDRLRGYGSGHDHADG